MTDEETLALVSRIRLGEVAGWDFIYKIGPWRAATAHVYRPSTASTHCASKVFVSSSWLDDTELAARASENWDHILLYCEECLEAAHKALYMRSLPRWKE